MVPMTLVRPKMFTKLLSAPILLIAVLGFLTALREGPLSKDSLLLIETTRWQSVTGPICTRVDDVEIEVLRS